MMFLSLLFSLVVIYVNLSVLSSRYQTLLVKPRQLLDGFDRDPFMFLVFGVIGTLLAFSSFTSAVSLLFFAILFVGFENGYLDKPLGFVIRGINKLRK